jgi:hypothetical protein
LYLARRVETTLFQMKKNEVIMALALLFILILYFWGKDILSKIRKIGLSYDNLIPDMRIKCGQLEAEAERRGIPVLFWQGWRSPEESAANIAAGVSFVTDPLNSYHCWGAAIDYVKAGPGGIPMWPDKTDQFWQDLASLYDYVDLEPGARWNNFDGAHGQMKISMSQIRREYGDDYQNFINNGGAV